MWFALATCASRCAERCYETLRQWILTPGLLLPTKKTRLVTYAKKHKVKSLVFSCCKCGKEFTQGFKDFKYASPMECPNAPTCRGHFFRPMTSSAVTCDWQGIRIQENLRDDVREVGRMPRTLDIELVSDLIDSCNPGDTVTICGVSKALNVEAGNNAGGRASKAKTHSLFKLYIDANSVASSGRSRKRRRKATDDDITDEDLTAFEEISGDLNTFELLAHSICPSIYGHELVKAGILLTLLGGSQKPETTEVCVRPDIHCLIVGDPGLGKSQLLKATTNVAPRGIYVCGNTSTTAGLTVTMVKESGSNDYFLEAGALVLGDEGICCIDEFDKMGSEHQALLEAMEQQTVSIAKAGMICNLKTKTSVVAAANPRGGHYDLSKTVCENLKIALPLLSRFDLVFILLDSPDKQKDRYISEHVLTACTSKKKKKGSVHRRPRSRETDAESEAERISLEKRLQKYRCDSPLPSVLFRKYISYARAHINPILSNSAKRVLQTFYLTLRRGMGNQTLDVPPVTTRQLESLKRLVEARAKAEHRQIATENDALDVIEILKASLVDTFSDEHGRIDFTRASGMSRTKEVKKFVMGLHAEAQRTGHDVFSMSDLKRIAQNLQLKIPMFEDFIDMINHQNVLLKRSKGYRLQGTQLG
uniref:DNA helicase n=1 Tax=Rhodosorus marinus TaxID=101924 RepID=A0A7S2ZNK1_9RHOD|mmetsp:Transcript_24556/g.96967  ORF Transcript_24556/g.96967 Transcript_24556/m.96967 type:complete len:647 (+) Transcript_24556:596-2536(+)